jgi:hypothetical protein
MIKDKLIATLVTATENPDCAFIYQEALVNVAPMFYQINTEINLDYVPKIASGCLVENC